MTFHLFWTKHPPALPHAFDAIPTLKLRPGVLEISDVSSVKKKTWGKINMYWIWNMWSKSFYKASMRRKQIQTQIVHICYCITSFKEVVTSETFLRSHFLRLCRHCVQDMCSMDCGGSFMVVEWRSPHVRHAINNRSTFCMSKSHSRLLSIPPLLRGCTEVNNHAKMPVQNLHRVS